MRYIRITMLIAMLTVLVACDVPPTTPAPIIVPDLQPSQSVSATDFQGRIMRIDYPEAWLARVDSSGAITLANHQNALGAWDVDIFSLRHGEMAGVIVAIDENSIANSWDRNLEAVMSNSRAQMTRYKDMRARFTANEAFISNGRNALITNGTLTRDEQVVEVIIIVVYDADDDGYASMLIGAPVGQLALYEPVLMQIAGTFDFIRQ
jgi:hypothetical protein